MGIPAGYTVGKQLKSETSSSVYTATREDGGAEVILKCYAPAPGAYARAQREFDSLRAIEHPGVPKAIEVLFEDESPTVVLQRMRGVRLDGWVAQGQRSIASVLRMGAALSDVLAAVHEAQRIHHEVEPQHVFVDPDTLEAALIDFGRSAPLGSTARRDDRSIALATLAYAAPEQTGLIDHGCDYRSDLYALGATLYYALCGRPPFVHDDPRELVHAHVARRPEPPSAIRADVPEPVSRLVLKLLSKEPDDRYQRAQALRADLVAMCEQLEARGGIDPGFELGSADAPARPHFSGRIYGREREIAQLVEAYERASRGAASALWIRGDAGSGKSALLEALRAHLGETSAYFARGKFDSYQERPYATWVSIVESLVVQLLVESDAHLVRWRTQLRDGLGNIAQALVELVPDLGAVLGEVEPVPELGPRETQARLSLALRRFVSVVATKEHPLVLCFDDLHWSDAGSRFLIGDILASEGAGALLLLAAYRTHDGEDPPDMAQLREQLAQRGIDPCVLDVTSLDLEATTTMLSDALGRGPDETRVLAQQLGQRMGYRPLLVRQFVDHLSEQGLLRHVSGRGWVWDPDEIASATIPDGAVALLTARIHRLDPDARSVLQFASCMGSEFDLDLLKELGCQVKDGIRAALYRLVDAGLIAVCSGGFRFSHDRLREATRTLLSPEERSRLHFETGKLLLASPSLAESEARVYEAADHLNRGLEHVGPELRIPLIELNLRAGKRALAAGAAAGADRYLQVACRMLAEDDWRERADVAFEVHLEAAGAAFQCGEHQRALDLLAVLDQHTRTDLDVGRVESLRLHVYAFTKEPEETLLYALDVLRRLGIRWPRYPSLFRARMALRMVRWRLRGRSGENMLFPATNRDPRALAILMVVAASAPVRSKIDVLLSALAAAEVLTQSIKHGYVGAPAYLLASYATFAQIVLEDGEDAMRVAAEAIAWTKRAPDPVWDPKVHFHVQTLLKPWHTPRRRALLPLEHIARLFQEAGDPEWAHYAEFLGTAYCALAGDPVDKVEERLAQIVNDVRRSGHRYPDTELMLFVYRLLGVSDPSGIRFEDEIAASDRVLRGEGRSAEPFIRTVWMFVLCIYGRFDLAYRQSEILGKRLFRATAYLHIADHTLLRGLSAAELGLHSRGASRRRYAREVARALRRLERWARGGPDFALMVTMLQAERARLRGQPARANRLYERAVREADARTFPAHAALAMERRAGLLIDMRRVTEARGLFAQATSRYAAWGAAGKVAALRASTPRSAGS